MTGIIQEGIEQDRNALRTTGWSKEKSN